jgi:hypothetical protein
MGIDYSAENPHSQLARLLAEGPHMERLTEAATMWRTAQQRIRDARDDLSTRTNALLASWQDDAGQAFGARVDESVRSLTAWHDRIEGAGVVGQINALQLTYPNCVAQVQAVCDRFQAALQAQQGDPATLERQYASEAAQYTSHVADRMNRVTVAMGTLAGAGPAWTGAGSGGSGGAGNAPGGSAEGERPPGAEQGAAGQAQGQQQGQQGGGQDPLQQGLSAAQQLAQQLGQQLGGAGGADPGTDPSLLDPTGSAQYPGTGPNGLPGLAGLGGAGGVGGGAGGGFAPMTQPMNAGSSPLPTGSAPGLAGAPPTGAASPGAGMGGMAPMMPLHGAAGGLGAAGGVRPGDAERTHGGRSREGRSAAVAGVPAALRGRSGGAARDGIAQQAPAHRREERANHTGEVLDEELWHVAGQDHTLADTKGTLRSRR